MKTTQIIILAAGKGTRMNSELPKVLVELKNKSLIERLFENLEDFGAGKMVIVTGHKRELVKN